MTCLFACSFIHSPLLLFIQQARCQALGENSKQDQDGPCPQGITVLWEKQPTDKGVKIIDSRDKLKKETSRVM